MESWSFDPNHNLVSFVDGSVKLTDQEGRAFCYLLSRAGSVVPREVLETEVWALSARI